MIHVEMTEPASELKTGSTILTSLKDFDGSSIAVRSYAWFKAPFNRPTYGTKEPKGTEAENRRRKSCAKKERCSNPKDGSMFAKVEALAQPRTSLEHGHVTNEPNERTDRKG
ncbi:MAG: hypothetical protein NTZ87_03005 [Candidatus Nomurabacteria bacterium]|nr:hypothetical protein [Candidatus Nomurabacteria bacterium]